MFYVWQGLNSTCIFPPPTLDLHACRCIGVGWWMVEVEANRLLDICVNSLPPCRDHLRQQRARNPRSCSIIRDTSFRVAKTKTPERCFQAVLWSGTPDGTKKKKWIELGRGFPGLLGHVYQTGPRVINKSFHFSISSACTISISLRNLG